MEGMEIMEGFEAGFVYQAGDYHEGREGHEAPRENPFISSSCPFMSFMVEKSLAPAYGVPAPDFGGTANTNWNPRV
jgi:hypothetical protein